MLNPKDHSIVSWVLDCSLLLCQRILTTKGCREHNGQSQCKNGTPWAASTIITNFSSSCSYLGLFYNMISKIGIFLVFCQSLTQA
jgi:hypothetical protein